MRLGRRLSALGFFFPATLHAQEWRQTAQPILPGVQEVAPTENERAVQGILRLESMQYLATVPENPKLTQSQFLSTRFSAQTVFGAAPEWKLATDVSAGAFVGVDQSDLSVHEFYAEGHTESRYFGTFGRQRQAWSDLDSRWQLGLWEPQTVIDALRPEPEGLTGFFVGQRRDDFEIIAFASPVFIPGTGPNVREEDGSLVSDNRWYRRPTSEFDFNNTRNQIVYHLNMPDTNDVVSHPSTAFMVRAGRTDRGPSARLAWGAKPVNDLLLARQNFKAITADRVDVTVAPTVTTHEIFSADVAYATETTRSSLSLLSDRPEERRPGEDWILQRLEPLQAYSAQVDWDVPFLRSRSVKAQLGYLKVEGGGITDIQANGRPDDFVLYGQRLKFTNTASLGAEGEIARIRRRPLAAKWRYLYDFDQRGSMINAELTYSPEQRWALLLGADVLGVEDETHQPDSFLNQFRANDRVYGGMTYVF